METEMWVLAVLILGLIYFSIIGTRMLETLTAIRQVQEWTQSDILSLRANQEQARQAWLADQRRLMEENQERAKAMAREVINESAQIIKDAEAVAKQLSEKGE